MLVQLLSWIFEHPCSNNCSEESEEKTQEILTPQSRRWCDQVQFTANQWPCPQRTQWPSLTMEESLHQQTRIIDTITFSRVFFQPYPWGTGASLLYYRLSKGLSLSYYRIFRGWSLSYYRIFRGSSLLYYRIFLDSAFSYHRMSWPSWTMQLKTTLHQQSFLSATQSRIRMFSFILYIFYNVMISDCLHKWLTGGLKKAIFVVFYFWPLEAIFDFVLIFGIVLQLFWSRLISNINNTSNRQSIQPVQKGQFQQLWAKIRYNENPPNGDWKKSKTKFEDS